MILRNFGTFNQLPKREFSIGIINELLDSSSMEELNQIIEEFRGDYKKSFDNFNELKTLLNELETLLEKLASEIECIIYIDELVRT